MKIFKNSVGRPSNETIQKRKIIVIIIVAVSIVCLGAVGYTVFNAISNPPIEGAKKNAYIAKNWVGKNFVVDIDPSKNSKFSATIAKCPNGYHFSNQLDCVKADQSTRNLSYTYTCSIITAISNSSSKCKNLGYNNYRDFKYDKTKKKITVTCYNPIRKNVERMFLASYYNQKEISSSVMSVCGGGSRKLKDAGCLPSASAMVFVSLYGGAVTPVSVNDKAKQLIANYDSKNKKINNNPLTSNGYCAKGKNCYTTTKNKVCDSDGDSFYASVLNDFTSLYKLNLYDLNSASKVDSYLKIAKCMGIAALNPKSKKTPCNITGCYGSGHFVAFFPSEDAGYAYLSDPWDRNNKAVKVLISDIIKYSQNSHVRVICKK